MVQISTCYHRSAHSHCANICSAFFNNVTYIPPVVPSLYTALSTGAAATDAEVYGDYTSSYVLKKGDVVEIIVNNNDTGKHPFHLHGHNFQVVYRTPWNFGEFEPSTEVRDFADVPMRRDTVMVTPMGNMVLRFVADNPGKSSNGNDPLEPEQTNKWVRRLVLPLSHPVAQGHWSRRRDDRGA